MAENVRQENKNSNIHILHIYTHDAKNKGEKGGYNNRIQYMKRKEGRKKIEL
jgi:hypothetical protein